MRPGRPTKFCKEVCDKILEALENGYTQRAACGYAGIGYSTYKEWKVEAEGHKTDTPKKCFFREVDAALAKREHTLDYPVIEAINDGDVKVALKYMELRLRAKIARDAKEAQLLDNPDIEYTEDDVEWIDNVSSYT